MAEPATTAVRGRFAPSPSGRMHVGNLFSALLAWLSARSQGGTFVLRLEDIDERCRDARAAALIEDDLHWLGLDWDGPAVRQTQRMRAYEQALEQLARVARLYPCFCSRADLHAASAPHASDGTPVYAGACRTLTDTEVAERRAHRSPALRIQVPAGNDASCTGGAACGFERQGSVVRFCDGHMGAQTQDLASECGDFIVRRSDGAFAYQLAVVVDDAAAGVSEVVRGSDLVSSTPRQIWLHELLGLPVPRYCHHPLLRAPDGRRLSKREKSLDVGVLREAGTAPEALVGWLAWCAGLLDEARPVAAAELVDTFSWGRVCCEDVTLASDFLPTAMALPHSEISC